MTSKADNKVDSNLAPLELKLHRAITAEEENVALLPANQYDASATDLLQMCGEASQKHVLTFVGASDVKMELTLFAENPIVAIAQAKKRIASDGPQLNTSSASLYHHRSHKRIAYFSWKPMIELKMEAHTVITPLGEEISMVKASW